MDWVRKIGALLLAAGAVTIWFALAPEPAAVASAPTTAAAEKLPSDTVTRADIAQIMVGDSLNQTSADSAPKQTVVNGWTARDLLEAIAQQGADTYQAIRAAAEPIVFPPEPEPDERPAALLTLGVAGVALLLFTSEGRGGRRRTALTGDTPPSATPAGGSASAGPVIESPNAQTEGWQPGPGAN